jgi:2'-5' RNA ligase
MRLFIAVWPPADVLDGLAALPRPAVAGLRWTSPSQWHVTMRFLGALADDIEAIRAFGNIRVDAIGAVRAAAGPALGRFGQRILHVPVAGLERLAAEVDAATAEVGEPPDPRPFHGHITLARAKGRRPVADLRPLAGQPFVAAWPVEELTLVSSVGVGRPGGPEYEVIARLPLVP